MKDLDGRILDLLSLDEAFDQEDIEAEVESAMEFIVNVNKSLFKINEKLVKKEVLKNDDDNRSSCYRSESMRVSIAITGGTILRMNLPKLELQKFSGDSKKFTSWWDSYDSVIDRNDLLDVEKFQYLCSLLVGKALNAITGLPPTSENYHHVIEILQSRFGKKDVENW